MRARTKQLLAAALVAFSTISIAVVLSLSGEGPSGTVTIQVGGPHGTPTTELEVPKAAVQAVAESQLDDHEGARGEVPPGVKPAVLEAAQAQQEALAANDQLPIVSPLAAPQQRGCVTRLVQNYSSRRGIRPRLFVLHYTVSANRPGWSDVNAIVGLFDRPAFQASSHYIVDAEGNCAYIVREPDKAWTQAAANPVSLSVEIINSGREPTLSGARGLAKLGQVCSDSTRRWEIPLQRGLVVGGRIIKPGIVQHKDFGAFGGGHYDISPFSVETVLAACRKARGGPGPIPRTPPARRCDLGVASVQRALNRRGARLLVDGAAGSATRAALVRFQRNHGLTPFTGVAGVRTARALGLCA